MNTYEKPVIKMNEEVAEGVYAASGSDCWDVSVDFTPHADKVEVQISAYHTNSTEPHKANLSVTIEFNKPINGGSSTILSTGANIGTSNPTENKVWNETVHATDGDNQSLSIVDYHWSCNG